LTIERENLSEVFSGLISKTREEHEVNLTDFSQQYVVGVLCGFIDAPEVLPGGAVYPGDLLRLAADQKGLIRSEYLRLCGDVALFVSGIFPDSLDTRRRALTLGDYIDVGREAYGRVGGMIFSELSGNFPVLVDILNDVSIDIDLTRRDLARYIRRRRQIDERLTYR